MKEKDYNVVKLNSTDNIMVWVYEKIFILFLKIVFNHKVDIIGIDIRIIIFKEIKERKGNKRGIYINNKVKEKDHKKDVYMIMV